MALVLTSLRGQPGETLELIAASQGSQLVLVEQQAALEGGVQPLVSTLGLDGSVNPPAQELLAAGHAPGMYLVYRYILRRALPTAGSITVTVAWSDAMAASTANTQNLALVPGAGSIVNPGVIAVFSDGTVAITNAIAFTGMVGVCNVDVRSWCVRQQG